MPKFIPLLLVLVLSACADTRGNDPDTQNLSFSTAEDTAKTADLSAFQVENNIVSYRLISSPEHGTITVESDGIFTYTPNENYNGEDSFVYEVTNSDNETSTGTVTITVTPENDKPTADNSATTGDEDTDISGQLSGGDIDGDNLTYIQRSNPSNGSVSITDSGAFTYTPNANFNGSDSFEFATKDASQSSSSATVSITVNPVNDAPVANAQSKSINEEQALNDQLSASDVDGDNLAYSLNSQASSGTATVQTNGAYTYLPNDGYSGTDSFTFTVSDGNNSSDTATVTITISNVNDAPVASDKTISVDEDTNVTDTVSASDEDNDDSALVYALKDAASNGTAVVNSNGSIEYTPDADFNGSDSFTYTATDSGNASDTGTVSVTVNPINDKPVANDQTLTTDEDTDVTGQANVSDVDNNISELSYRLSRSANNGAASISATGALSYTPNTNYNGTDSFEYEVVDPDNAIDTATVSITINPVDDPPSGVNDIIDILVSEDTLFSDQLDVTDPDSGTTTYALSTSNGETAQFGTASVNEETGEYNYQPAPNYNGGNGDAEDYQDDQFKIVVLYNGVEAGRITINVEVTPVNDTPLAEDGYYGTQKDQTLNGNLPATDVDGDTLTFALADDLSMGGSVTVNSDGSFEYIPPTDQALEDSFTFTVSDGEETSPPATAFIAVVENLGESTDYDLTSEAGPSPAQVGTPPPPGPPVIIHFTVHEPTNFSSNQKYPLVLEGHGYGGRRTNAGQRQNGGFKGLLNAGYGVISITQRGFGRTEGHTDTGNIRLFDPNYEGRDLMQVIDWAEDNLDWVMYKNTSGEQVDKTDAEANIVLGAIGGSYGGGYQHTVAAIDAKKRIDALAPEITWYDLRYSLFSGNAFKTYWAGLLSAAGNGTGSQDPEVNQGLAQGVSANFLDDDKLKLLYEHSFISHCEDNSRYTHNVTATGGVGPNESNTLEPVDALYWQSPGDTLFNMNEMRLNAACLIARGADVRALTKVNGHDGGTGSNCGTNTVNQTVVDWFDEKLKGITGKADYIPDNCFNLRVDNDTVNDHITTATFPVGGQEFVIEEQSITANGNNLTPTQITLFTTTEETILAGIPTATLTLGGPFAPPPELPDPGLLPTDPILFIGLTIGNSLQMGNQVRPIRQYKTHEIELVGLNVKIPADTEVKLSIYPGFPARYPNSGTKQPTPVTLQGTVQLPLH